MSICRWLAVAFSLYSRIPMPRFDWREDDMAHSLLFFPFVGAVIGGVFVVADVLAAHFGLPLLAHTLLLMLVPIIITGGFHLDGYMDTEDAIRSYKTKEEKLEILKDPHIGAFAVIGLVRVLLFVAGAIAVLIDAGDLTAIRMLAISFFLSRILSGLTSIYMKKARQAGMLHAEAGGVKAGVKAGLWIQLAVATGLLVYVNLIQAVILFSAFLASLLWYRYQSRRHYGGVTGDTAGRFVVSSETFAALMLAIAAKVIV
ncbi:MAG: adenosylcobinamide-GDP ribazoletransferase [Lachnospiraceae bacterium]|nr:adenosylcobinamide-GDP ribazoletransferase [Lachnospiraceae bacterium]